MLTLYLMFEVPTVQNCCTIFIKMEMILVSGTNNPPSKVILLAQGWIQGGGGGGVKGFHGTPLLKEPFLLEIL